MTIDIKWFPPSWIQIKVDSKIIYIDPAYLRTYFTKYPKKIEFSKWPDPIDGLPEDLEKADIILITHDHAGDTDFIHEMKQLGPVNTALLPIGGTYTMDLNDAVKAAISIKPTAVIPIHHLKANPQKFQKMLEVQSGLTARILQIGESYQLI